MAADEVKVHKHFITFETHLKRLRREFEVRITNAMREDGDLTDFELMKALGSGSFGKVVLVRHKYTDRMHAMKVMEKANIVKTKQVLHTMAEVRLMDGMEFPFIIKLNYFFKDNVYVFIVMPFINGGDMFIHLRRMKKFDEDLSKFYAAQVVMAFEYMHFLGIVYRDLKPENILIDRNGYLKITDLGFCKKIDTQRTYTLCGTPEYLAPEIILSQGYNKSVDWWACGVLIYEMSAGYPPFFAKDHIRLYEKIVSGKFSCPAHFSRPLKDLVNNILVVDRTKRFGMLKAGAKDVKGHDWFRGTDFEGILQRKVESSFVPKVAGEGDTSNFEPSKNMELRHNSINEYPDEFSNFAI